MTRVAAGAMRVALAGMCLLAAACGLPMPGGVHVPGQVRADDPQPGDVRVLPPGPRAGAGPADVVAGFLGAQSAPEDGHAVARQFLAPAAQWDDEAGLEVYDPETLTLSVAATDRSAVVVTATTTGRILGDGSYDSTVHVLRETYHLVRRGAAWRLAELPQGLRLTPADRVRSFRSYNLYFISSPPDRPASTSPHLVADLVFLPVSTSPVQALVRRLLEGPSSALSGQVQTALPSATGLRRPVTRQNGTVTVDLSPQVQALDDGARARLSAQLVWTLRGAGPEFQRLRLLAGGRPLEVRGRAAEQQRTDWADFDPDGLQAQAPAYALVKRALRTVDAAPDPAVAATGRPAGIDAPVPVDDAAVSPSGGQVALLTATSKGIEVRTGRSQGPYALRARAPGVRSPSWGSEEDGLWLLRDGQPVLVRDQRGDRSAAPWRVPLDGPDIPRRSTAMRLSRDGARVAIVADAQLYVGRVERAGGGLRLGDLRRIAGSLSGVRAVDWQSDTLLVVLAKAGQQGPLPVRVAVDGSFVSPVARAGLVGTPTSLAAAPDRPLIIATNDAGTRRLFRDDGRFFQPQGSGSGPFYPG